MTIDATSAAANTTMTITDEPTRRPVGRLALEERASAASGAGERGSSATGAQSPSCWLDEIEVQPLALHQLVVRAVLDQPAPSRAR